MTTTYSTAQSLDDPDLFPVLQQVILNNDSVLSVASGKGSGDILTEDLLVLDKRHNNITFGMTPGDSVAYQFFLEGFDAEWSEWILWNNKQYTNLPAGDYALHVRYIDHYVRGGEIYPLDIKVLPLWYSSSPAFLLYIILFLLILWASYSQLNLRFARRQYMLEQIINKRTEDLIMEKEKTEALLDNVLPKNTANEIMAKGKATKTKYNFVTVLFSDIQGFTKIAEEMNPEVLIDELDKFFFYFDSVAEKYGIEKIKTIGDAYMCAGGIPEKNRTNPVEVILAALEMREYMDNLKKKSQLQGMKYWDIRIGIHTGTVIAGVVGQKKLSYDIWGDTVNTASRMESSGEAGKINISGTTYEFVKDFFSCEYRGRMPVKYKGELEMYFVDSIIKDLRDKGGKPNRDFIIKMQMIKLQDIEEIITKMFDDEAPPNLYFHNSSMVKHISNQVDLLSNSEKLPGEEYVNLKLASIFLLTGFIYDYEKPLETSLRLVEEYLPKYGFNDQNIESVKGIIKNSFTDIQESMSDNILHDARYDYLGRIDYPDLTEKLLREKREYGMHSDTDSWLEEQKELLVKHEFHTNTARLLRSVSPEEQVKALTSGKE